jgi:hypothetical protein
VADLAVSAMNEAQKHSWERVRERGRDRFLLRSIGRACWIGGILFAIKDLGFVLFAKGPIKPWDWLIEWAFMSVGLGAAFGFADWEEKEKDYRESNEQHQEH